MTREEIEARFPGACAAWDREIEGSGESPEVEDQWKGDLAVWARVVDGRLEWWPPLVLYGFRSWWLADEGRWDIG